MAAPAVLPVPPLEKKSLRAIMLSTHTVPEAEQPMVSPRVFQ
jgi:hypothetical protein